jgi:hypothetical protein
MIVERNNFVLLYVFQTNWPKNGIEFAEYMHRRLHESSAVVIDDETCMANDNADKVCQFYITPQCQ